MAFVYEEVGEENRELWESIGWRNWNKREGYFIKSGEWCIDRERHICDMQVSIETHHIIMIYHIREGL